MGFGGSGGSGSSTIGGAGDVALNTPANNQVLTYNSSVQKWTNAAASGGGDVWGYGLYPRIIWSGSNWPARSASLPSGYSGPVEYWSASDQTASAPTDRQVGDIWTRVATV